MSMLVIPFPPPNWEIDDLPAKVCWWRYAAINEDKDGFVFTWIRHGDVNNDTEPSKAWDGVNYVTLEWNDQQDIILDAGMDRISIWGLSQVYIEPIEYIDLLSETRPAKLFYRITEYGNRHHPGMVVVRNLDRR